MPGLAAVFVHTDAGEGVRGSLRNGKGVLMNGVCSGTYRCCRSCAPTFCAMHSSVASILSRRVKACTSSSDLGSGLVASVGRLYVHSIPSSEQKEQAGFAASHRVFRRRHTSHYSFRHSYVRYVNNMGTNSYRDSLAWIRTRLRCIV